LVNGAAYQVEGLASKQSNVGAEEHNFQGTKKKDWNKKAKDDYQNWPHREKFEKFMQARMPHLKLGEIQALGRAICLKKSIDLQKGTARGETPLESTRRELASHKEARDSLPLHQRIWDKTKYALGDPTGSGSFTSHIKYLENAVKTQTKK
jgi:hypothetical protein